MHTCIDRLFSCDFTPAWDSRSLTCFLGFSSADSPPEYKCLVLSESGLHQLSNNCCRDNTTVVPIVATRNAGDADLLTANRDELCSVREDISDLQPVHVHSDGQSQGKRNECLFV